MDRQIVKLAVVGSRDFPEKQIVLDHLARALHTAVLKNMRIHIITGGAPGVDTWTEHWARRNQIMYTVIPAEWELFGKSAGFKRNPEIWDMADKGLAFWDGESKGTQDSFKLAADRNKQLVVINYKEILPW